jgi:replication-associated recombination protein RarA
LSVEQTARIADRAAFRPRSRLRELHELPVLERITIPLLGSLARNAVETILARRTELALPDARIADVIDAAALDALTEFYTSSGGDLRRVLAAAHEAAEHAAADQAERIGPSHARFGIAQWQ